MHICNVSATPMSARPSNQHLCCACFHLLLVRWSNSNCGHMPRLKGRSAVKHPLVHTLAGLALVLQAPPLPSPSPTWLPWLQALKPAAAVLRRWADDCGLMPKAMTRSEFSTQAPINCRSLLLAPSLRFSPCCKALLALRLFHLCLTGSSRCSRGPLAVSADGGC